MISSLRKASNSHINLEDKLEIINLSERERNHIGDVRRLLKNLITESRVPADNDRGYFFGPHSPLFTSRHTCDIRLAQCAKFIVNDENLAARENDPHLCIDVLLIPKCCNKTGRTNDIFTLFNEVRNLSAHKQSVLLERWILIVDKLRPEGTEGEKPISFRELSRAVLTYLGVSEIAAWLNINRGSLPFALCYSVPTVGKQYSRGFDTLPSMFTFPDCVIYKKYRIITRALCRPRDRGFPIAWCAAHRYPRTDTISRLIMNPRYHKQPIKQMPGENCVYFIDIPRDTPETDNNVKELLKTPNCSVTEKVIKLPRKRKSKKRVRKNPKVQIVDWWSSIRVPIKAEDEEEGEVNSYGTLENPRPGCSGCYNPPMRPEFVGMEFDEKRYPFPKTGIAGALLKKSSKDELEAGEATCIWKKATKVKKLLVNFEESLLKGCMREVCKYGGYRASLSVTTGKKPVKVVINELMMEMDASLYELEGFSNDATPFIGVVSLASGDIPVPPKGMLILRVIAPSNNVSQTYNFEFDFVSMPPRHRTIVRLRYYRKKAHPDRKIQRMLRFMLQLKVRTNHQAVCLYDEIKIIAVNRAGDHSMVIDSDMYAVTENSPFDIF